MENFQQNMQYFLFKNRKFHLTLRYSCSIQYINWKITINIDANGKYLPPREPGVTKKQKLKNKPSIKKSNNFDTKIRQFPKKKLNKKSENVDPKTSKINISHFLVSASVATAVRPVSSSTPPSAKFGHLPPPKKSLKRFTTKSAPIIASSAARANSPKS